MPHALDTPPPSPPPGLKLQQEEAFRLRQEHHTGDVIIVGAGVIGCALAVTLARQGRSVILLERTWKAPDRIVGELLQPGGVEALTKLGLRDCLEDIDAIPVHGYVIFYHGEPVEIPYPENSASPKTNVALDNNNLKHKTDSSLRPQGRSFHHGRFIAALRKACTREPNISIFETNAISPIESTYSPETVLGVNAKTQKGDEKEMDYFFAPLTIAADGSSSAFRKVLHPHKPVSRSKFFALELKDCDLPNPYHGHVVLGDMPPILLYQIGTHETRILVDIPERCPTASDPKAHFEQVVRPNLPERALPSFDAAMSEFGKRSMPNSWLPPVTQGLKKHGLVLLGDAMNMRHPLTGGGMTVALNDVVLFRDLVEDISDLGDHKRMKDVWQSFHWGRKGLTSVINILAMALYSLFAADDNRLRALQRGCFKYFQFGGKCVDEPVGLLAGILRQPFVLFYHFFAVALLAIWMAFRDTPIWRLPIFPFDAAAIFWTACVVIFPFIFSELKA